MNEKATVTMADGEVRENQKVRSYSWLIANGNAIAAVCLTAASRSS